MGLTSDRSVCEQQKLKAGSAVVSERETLSQHVRAGQGRWSSGFLMLRQTNVKCERAGM